MVSMLEPWLCKRALRLGNTHLKHAEERAHLVLHLTDASGKTNLGSTK